MYPVPAVVTVAAVIAPELIVTEATPLEPSPRIGIAEIVEPEDVPVSYTHLRAHETGSV